jgi:hypothetical protein
MSDMVDAIESVEQAVGRVEQAVNKGNERWSTVQLIFATLVGFWLISLPGQIWHAKWRYAFSYGVSSEKVLVAKQPHDCAFLAAPLGTKYCHYKRLVYGYNTAGDLLAGDDAPIYSSDVQTGRPTVSYDNRKTWQLIPEGSRIDTRVDRVEIEWVKAED